MREVVIPKPRNETLTAQLIALYETFKGTEKNEELKFNLSKLDWAYPLLALPLSAYIHATKSEYEINQESAISSYLGTIHFPAGIHSPPLLNQLLRSKKNYLPISILRRDQFLERERLEWIFAQLVFETLRAAQGTLNAIYYPISELVGNIFDHSERGQGFIMGQFYPKKNYLDICIADCGRGLTATYQEEKGLKLTDEEAIAQVMTGHSTKADKERGFGVRTSKRVVCEGLNGGFIMVSGGATLITAQQEERLVSLPSFYWQGVIIAYRIPRPESPIDITPFLE